MNCLVETSVITRLSHTSPGVRDAIHQLREQGDTLARCVMTDLEIGFSARNVEQWDARIATLAPFRELDVTGAHFHMAKKIQRDLAQAGVSGRKLPDLLIAAVAIDTGLTLVHYDADFDHIASVSELHHQWIVPRGTID